MTELSIVKGATETPLIERTIGAFPMTVTGKIQKYLIRNQMKGELGLTESKTA